MNAMVNIMQWKVSHRPTAKCQLCPNVYYHHIMFDGVATSGRVCFDCWDAYKKESRTRQKAKDAKKKQEQMELVA